MGARLCVRASVRVCALGGSLGQIRLQIKPSFVLVLGVETRGGTNATCQTAKNWRVLDISRLLAVDGSIFVSMLSHMSMCPGHRDNVADTFQADVDGGSGRVSGDICR